MSPALDAYNPNKLFLMREIPLGMLFLMREVPLYAGRNFLVADDVPSARRLQPQQALLQREPAGHGGRLVHHAHPLSGAPYVYIYIYMCVCVFVCLCVYIYIDR